MHNEVSCQPVPTFHHLSGDDDFEGDKKLVRFETVSNEATFTLAILNDDNVECLEEFSLELEISPETGNRGVIKGTPSTATVTIRDTDCECYSCSKTQPAPFQSLHISLSMYGICATHAHSPVSCSKYCAFYPSIISVCVHTVARVSFTAQNYMVMEGDSVALGLEVDKQFCCPSRSFPVTTMDDTAKGKWKVSLHRKVQYNHGGYRCACFSNI